MNKDEVIALAEKCKLAVLIHSQWTHQIKEFTVVDYVVEGDLGSLMQFAALVASAEREKYEAIITNMTKLLEAQQNREGVAVDMIAAGIAAEREACAEVCKKHADFYAGLEQHPTAQSAWAACIDNLDTIRARGQA